MKCIDLSNFNDFIIDDEVNSDILKYNGQWPSNQLHRLESDYSTKQLFTITLGLCLIKYPAVCTVRTNKTFYSFLDVNRFDRELELVV